MYKCGKAILFLGSFHGSDVPEFYGSSVLNGTAPDLIGTDVLGMFLNFTFHCHADTHVFSRLREYWQPQFEHRDLFS